MIASYIQKLVLQNFRSFPVREIIFDPKQTLILGDNGKGKTNLLEAISLLSVGQSFRSRSTSECVAWGSEVSHVEIACLSGEDELNLKMSIISPENKLGQRGSSKYQRNDVKKKKTDVVGILKSVVFCPEDLEIVDGSPAVRRDFLNSVLVQVSHKYHTALQEYEKALKRRNKLILMLRDGMVSRKDFFFWDELLIKHGDVLTRARAEFVHFVNDLVIFPIKGKLIYDSSIISKERLHQYANAEVGAGKTLVGPHRDSLKIETEQAIGLHDVAIYGSRGQQRLAVMWLKIAQLKYIEQEAGVAPVLLLDDIFSELDDDNRAILFPLFEDHQVILTSAERLDALPEECRKGAIINL